MAIESIQVNTTPQPLRRMSSFMSNRKEISYGHINVKKNPSQENQQGLTKKDPFKVEYTVVEMLSMAAAGNIGGILLSSIGEPKEDKKKKWKEGAFQMCLTSAPMLLVDGAIKLCGKSKNPKINNNFTKIIASAAGVAIGSNTAVAISNKLRSDKEAKKPKRELKLIDMIANLDDFVAICVLAKIPFANKIHIERALPFIYSFCGFRSGTGDKR